mgnify:FL=1
MPTQEDGVGQVCRASLFPGQGMVDLTVLDRLRAPRVPAGSISGDYSASLPRCEQTFASPRVENFPGRREHDAANRRVACQPGKLRHRQCGSIVKSGRLCSGQNRNVGFQSVHRLTHTGFSTSIERSSAVSGAGKALRKRHPSRAKNARHINVVESHCARLLPRDPRRHPLLPLYTELDMVSIFCSIFSIAYSQSRPLQDVRRRRLRTSRATSARTSRASQAAQPRRPNRATRTAHAANDAAHRRRRFPPSQTAPPDRRWPLDNRRERRQKQTAAGGSPTTSPAHRGQRPEQPWNEP